MDPTSGFMSDGDDWLQVDSYDVNSFGFLRIQK